MNIAVNTRLLIDKKLDGIGWFTYNTLKYITQKHPEHHFFFIFDRKYNKKFIFSDNITGLAVPPPTRHPILWYIWLRYSLPKILKKYKIDIFISPDGFLPLRTKVQCHTVIHDINFAHNPQDLPKSSASFYNKYFPMFAQKADRIATVSEFSRQDISKTYQIPPNKIDVVYNGANKEYKPVSDSIKNKIKQKYTKKQDFFVFIGSLHPRKNLKRLILAFEKFKNENKSELKLIIIGAIFFKNSDFFNTLQKLKYKDDIIFTGRVETEELHQILASAIALSFVPNFEGFGIPILEAMYCDVPVISSNVTSMPEVAGDAAIYVNPTNVQEIAEALSKIANNKQLREDLISKGKIQREKFSWEKTADKLWSSINKSILQQTADKINK